MYDPMNQMDNQNQINNPSETAKTDSTQNTQNTQNVQSAQTTQTGQTYGAYQQGAQNGQSNPNSQPPYTPGGYSQQVWQAGQPEWDGSAYHYAAPQPPKQKKPKREHKPMSRGKKIAVRITAAVLACTLVSAGSIAAFAALINGGYITVGNTGSTTPAFTINHMVSNGDNSTTSQTTSGELSLQEVAEKVLPSVVCVQNYQRTQNNYSYFFGGSDDNGSEEQDAAEGSGIIASADGYIITNAHVVDGADSLKVVLYDGSTYEAQLIGSDSVTDLAVIKIDAANLVPATFGSSDDLRVADQVIAIGNPGGMQFSSSVTVGYVSALNRTVTTEAGYTMQCIQTDAAINPGNSGGALVNTYGQVVGITSSKFVSSGYENLGFAIPINTAQPIVSDLQAHGYVTNRALLGISGQYVDSMTARFYGFPSGGMYVAEITNPSVSAAGVTQGCLITKIDDVDVTSQTAITSYLVQKAPGDTVTLEVYNGLSQQTFTVDVTLMASGSSNNE